MPKCKNCGKENSYTLCDGCCKREKEKNLEALYHIEPSQSVESTCSRCGGSGSVRWAPGGRSYRCSCQGSD